MRKIVPIQQQLLSIPILAGSEGSHRSRWKDSKSHQNLNTLNNDCGKSKDNDTAFAVLK